jgi:taurine dioxygenase
MIVQDMQKTLQVVRIGTHLGAEIRGVDLTKPVDDATFAEIERAYYDQSVIVFRNQHISEEQHIAFSRRFGNLEVHVSGARYLHPRHPEVRINSNIIENGKPIGATDAGQYWHTDLSYMAEPSKCSLLYAVEVPVKDGKPLGDTQFVSVTAAYDALAPDMKKRLESLRAVHSYSYRYYKLTDAGKQRPQLTEEQKARTPDVEHPIVVTHPHTGRKCLFVNEGFTTQIVGMPESESRALLAELFAHVRRPEFLYSHKWAVGDLLMWDNLSTQHFAVADYALPLRRKMQRTTVTGIALH